MPGQSYLIDFWIANNGFSSPDSSVSVSFGDTVGFTQTAGNAPVWTYSEGSFTAIANSTTTVFAFSGNLDGGTFFLDDVSVYDTQSQFGYMTNAGGTTITITNYSGPGGIVTIPTNISGLNVTGIGQEALLDNNNLTSVTIPGSVTNIESGAFEYCSVLTNVIFGTVGTNLTTIGQYAFSDCFSLASATIPGSVASIGNDAFDECISLTSLSLGNGITNLGVFAFAMCGLTNVTVPGSVISFQEGVFDQCSSLASATIGNGVTNIAIYGFYLCPKLATITIPGSVTSIGDYAFDGCTNLTSLHFEGNAPAADNTIFSGDSGVISYYLPGAAGWSNTFATFPAVEEVQSQFGYMLNPDGVTITITNYTGLGGAVNFPTNINGLTVTGIGDGEDIVFGAVTVTSVTIPGTVTAIGDYAFERVGLTSVTIPNSVTSIGNEAFYDCTSLAGITIGNGVTLMGEFAFGDCPRLGSVTISNGVTTIGVESFYLCTNLTSITIPSSVASIQEYAFYDCSNLTSIYFQGNAPSPDTTVFANDNSATVYYLSGNTGFGSSYDNRPTATYGAAQPFIVTPPANAPPTQVGLPATFTVVASGSPPLSYQWQLNNFPLSTGGDFSGVHSPILTVSPVALADAGTYSVTVSNSHGFTNSSTAVLSVVPDSTATQYFEAGTNYVAAGDFALANLSFANALSLSPNNATDIFFLAASGLLSLPEQPAGSNFLSHIGIGSAGRDIFNWQATEPTNSSGHLEVPAATPPLNADEFGAQLRTNVLPAIITAQNNLAQITDQSFTVNLTTNETHAGAVTVDWGDVQMLRAMCDFAELFIYTTYSWNLNVQLSTASNFFGTDGDFEAFLTNYPSVLTTASTADLPAAEGAFTSAINEYFSASQFIRSRPEGEVRLFNLKADDLTTELKFRQDLSNLLASLNVPTALGTKNPGTLISMQAFFSGSFDLRSFLPEFQGNDFVWNTFPDTTFGGFVSGLTESQLGKGFLKRPFHSEGVLDLTGTSLSVLYNFTNSSDQSGVVQGPDGNFYGTTIATGALPPFLEQSQTHYGFGSIFQVTTNGQFSTLYPFGTQPSDGASPNALVLGSDGNLYGTTQTNGVNFSGTFFKITISGQFTNLYNFGTVADHHASTPVAALVEGNDGNFYGTTLNGGDNHAGTIFVISASGALTNLYSFNGASDGSFPAAPLAQGSDGNFYGTTGSGGVVGTGAGYGTIFEINPSQPGQIQVLYTFGTQQDEFGDPLDGAMPNGVVQGVDGFFYGTTQVGGAYNNYIAGNGGIWPYFNQAGGGTLFRFSPTNANSFATLLSFDENLPDGYNPVGSLLPGPDGSFYGVASTGGANNRGALFIFNPTNGAATNFVWLTASSGGYGNNLMSAINYDTYYHANPLALPSLLTRGLDGNLYGTTTDDGTNGDGTVYKLALSGPFSLVTLTTPANGDIFTAPASFSLGATVASAPTNTTVSFYNGTNFLGTSLTPPYGKPLSGLGEGAYAFFAVATNANGFSSSSAVSYVTVNNPGTSLIDFDPLADIGPEVGGSALSEYLAQYGVTVTNNSSGTTVVAENQSAVAGGGFVLTSSQPNILTQAGSGGPVSFTAGFGALLSQFSFTRPELLANPSVSHPAWQVTVFDPFGDELDSAQEPLIFSTTNVPAKTYTLGGGSIASAEFSSEGNGLTTFNAMLLDDFVLTAGNSSDLPPSVRITSPTNGQVFTTSADVPITVETSPGTGTATTVLFHDGGSFLTNTVNRFSLEWQDVPNGVHVLTAVANNNSGLTSTSAPVTFTLATGFAIVTPPMSQTIPLGGTAVFSVTTTGTGVTYQWLLNGVEIAGATHSSYAVSNAALGAAGNYTVAAVNSFGQPITSAPAVLTVLGPPTVSPITEVLTNGNFVLSVVVSDLTTNFYTKWLLNGNGIAGTTTSYPAGTVTNYYTNIDAAFNSGNYEVVAANVVASTNSLPLPVNLGPTNVITTNNSFANSLTIDPLGGPPAFPVAGINNSFSSGPSIIAGKPAGGFLWYNWTPTNNGVIFLTTRGSTFDTLLGIYTNDGVEPSVAEDDDSGGYFTSLVSFNFQSNVTYQIVVAGYQGATGNVVLELSPATNAGLPGPANGYTIGPAEPVITQQPSNQLVYVDHTVTLSVTATNATGYQWYFANVPVAGGTASTLVINDFPANAVGNYFVQLSNAVDSVQSEIASVELLNPVQTTGTPTNLMVDKFGDAADLTGVAMPQHYRQQTETGGYTLSQSFSTVGATKEEGEPSTAGQPGGASYWYTYTAPINGTLEFDTAGSTFNTMLAVYVGPGTSFSSLTNVGAAYTTNYLEQGQPEVVISNAVSGTKYYVSIDGYLGVSGSACLNIAVNPANGLVPTNVVPMTNTTPVVTITSPVNNYLTTNSTINVRGTVKGGGGLAPEVSVVQLTVNTNPVVQAPRQLAQKTVNWFTNVALVPGANLITAQSIYAPNTNTAFATIPATCTVFYVTSLPSSKDKSKLTLLTYPPGTGKITGQADNADLEINKVYAVKAAPVGNWVFTNWTMISGTNTNSLGTQPALAFLMSTNLVLQANFVTNPFTAWAGAYNGLFSPVSGVTEASSGFFTATIPSSSHGAYSAKLLLDGGSYPLSGTFDLSLQASAILARTGKPPLTVVLQLANNQIFGRVSGNATNAWFSELHADRAQFNSKSDPATDYTGKYTLVIPPGSPVPTNEPGGYGYATLATTPAGVVSLSGSLADNTAFSQSVPVATNGSVPLYASLYSKTGSFQGWLTLTNFTNHLAQTIVGANLAWIKPATSHGGGFTNTNISVLGSLYLPPTGGSSGLDLTNGTLIISNSNSGDVLTYSNLSIVNDKLANQTATGNPPNLLEGALTPATGVFTATFRPNGATANTVAKGVVLQDGSLTNAAGWFFDGGESGSFLLLQQ
ncbi:MAG: leucine-rich repeat protein [Verrucomicrobiota bacterium]